MRKVSPSTPPRDSPTTQPAPSSAVSSATTQSSRYMQLLAMQLNLTAAMQRGPAQAAVYGVVLGANSNTRVSVMVADATKPTARYTVDAAVEVTTISTQSGIYARWKALLPPSRGPGGNFTIQASCTACAAPKNHSVLHDITFGDVWFCSGQSNMWLPMHMDTSRNVTYDRILQGKYRNIRMHSVC